LILLGWTVFVCCMGKWSYRLDAHQAAETLLAKVGGLGLSVLTDGDNLLIRPSAKLNDELRAALRKAKPELLTILRARERKRFERVEMLLDYIERLGGKWQLSRDRTSFEHVGGGAPLARELLTNYPEETFACVLAAQAIFWSKHGIPIP
jgi:hypothetical protein